MKAQKSPKISVSVSLPANVTDLARQAAFDDNRPLSGLVCCLLEDYLVREGYLEPCPPRCQRALVLHEPAAAYDPRPPQSARRRG